MVWGGLHETLKMILTLVLYPFVLLCPSYFAILHTQAVVKFIKPSKISFSFSPQHGKCLSFEELDKRPVAETHEAGGTASSFTPQHSSSQLPCPLAISPAHCTDSTGMLYSQLGSEPRCTTCSTDNRETLTLR